MAIRKKKKLDTKRKERRRSDCTEKGGVRGWRWGGIKVAKGQQGRRGI